MTAPNIVLVGTITGKSTGLALTNQAGTTANKTIVANASGSNKVIKVNTLIVSNIHGSSSHDVTAYVNKNGGSNFHIAYTIAVPADATLVLISKDTSIYLEENDSLLIYASSTPALSAVCSYEEIS